MRRLIKIHLVVCCIQVSHGSRKTRMHERLDVDQRDVSMTRSLVDYVCCCKEEPCTKNAFGRDKEKAVNHDPSQPDVNHIEKGRDGEVKPRCCKRLVGSCTRGYGYALRRVDAWCESQDHPEYAVDLRRLADTFEMTWDTPSMLQAKLLADQRVKFDGRRRRHVKQPIEWPKLSMLLSAVRMGLLDLDTALQRGDVVGSFPDARFRHCNAHLPNSTMRILPRYEVKVGDTIIQDGILFVDFRGCFASPSNDFQEMDLASVSEWGDYLERTSVWQNTVGQSGSAVFIFGKYVLKQVKEEEMETFSIITHRGEAHWGLGKDIKTCGENSLLTPFFFAMKLPHDAHWWILMEKIGLDDREEDFWYDIKGPLWAGIKDGKSYMDASFGDGKIASHKDLGFSRHVSSDKAGFELRDCDCRRLSELVRSDVQLLRHAGITDYSLFFKLYKNTGTTRYTNESTCDPHYLPNGPKRSSECFRQYPVVLETPRYTLAVGIVDFGERGWKALPMSTMTEPSLYAQSFQQSLPQYFGCSNNDKTIMRQKYLHQFHSFSPKLTEVICDCPVLIKEGGSAGDDSSMFVRVTSPDANFKCSVLTEPSDVQPQCFNGDGQYIGTPHKFLNTVDPLGKDSHILCVEHGSSRESMSFRMALSRPWSTHSKDLIAAPAYWQIGNYATGKTCKNRRIPDDSKVDIEQMLQQTMTSLADGTHERYVVRRSKLNKQAHSSFLLQPKDFNLTVYPKNQKPSVVLEYSRMFFVGESNRGETVFDVCNEILHVGLVAAGVFKLFLNNAARGYDVYTFEGVDAAGWVRDILSAQASCEYPCLGTAEQLTSLSHCAVQASMLNEDLEDDDISNQDVKRLPEDEYWESEQKDGGDAE